MSHEYVNASRSTSVAAVAVSVSEPPSAIVYGPPVEGVPGERFTPESMMVFMPLFEEVPLPSTAEKRR